MVDERLRPKLRLCRTADDVIALAKSEGVELDDAGLLEAAMELAGPALAPGGPGTSDDSHEPGEPA